MKTASRLAIAVLTLTSAASLLQAQAETTPPDAVPSFSFDNTIVAPRSELLQTKEDPLLRPLFAAPDFESMRYATARSADRPVALAPFIVRGDPPLPEVVPPRETSSEKFFRTGTVFQHVGRKTTSRFWIKGDRGLMVSFSR